MKRYKDLSVKTKVPLMIGISSLVVLSLVCVLLLIPLRRTSLDDASKMATLSAFGAGERLAERINGAASVIRAYAGVIENLIETDVIPAEQKREFLMSEIRLLQKREKLLTNVWCIFEPNLFDGLDSMYIDTVGSTAEGVFAPRFISGKMMTIADELIESFLTEIPKRTGLEIITEPYPEIVNGEKLQKFSISIPVISKGAYVGVVGTSFFSNELNDLISSINTHGTGKLVTSKGVIAVYNEEDRIGNLAERGNREILDRLSEGKQFDGFYMLDGKEQYKVYVPVMLGVDNKPWFYAIDVPKRDIYEIAHNTGFRLIFYCILGVILIALAGWFLVVPILKDVLDVTKIIRKLSHGHINLQIEASRNEDEIGQMKNELTQLVDGLQHTADFARDIGKGNLNAKYKLLSDDDVLGNSLLEMRESLQKAGDEQSARAKEEEYRNWGTAGLAKFAEILRRDNTNMEALAYNVISNMVRYLDANQGGIFIMNDSEHESEKYLELKGCYAFDRKKFEEKRILPGEGLVGACYLEGEPIYMTKIPDDYINITSGLGDANPQAVFICPLKVNDEIYGVLELASFEKFEPYKIDFIQKVSESIAATISTVRVNLRTSRLLEQSKIQAEELVNHEEELRQTMEEMQATQEEMRRREKDLSETMDNMKIAQEDAKEKEFGMKQFHNAIYEMCNLVEISPEGIIVDLNKNMLSFFEGHDRSFFIGKKLGDIIGEDNAKAAWTNIMQGKIHENLQSVPSANGETMYFRQQLMPIYNEHGDLLQVLLVTVPDEAEEIRRDMEKMKSQEEEIRQNMEEIQATLEESRQKDHEIQQFHDGIYAANNVVEFSAEAYITDTNQNMLDILGLNKSEIIGKHVVEFIGEEEFKKASASLFSGKIFENKQQVNIGGKIMSFKQKFMPISSKEGKLERVLLLAFPDQEEELREHMNEIQKYKTELEQKFEEKTKDLSKALSENEFQFVKMSLVVDASDIGLWDMNVIEGDPVNPNNTFQWSNEFRQMLGYSDESDFPNILSSWSDKLHPEDKERTLDAFATHLLDRTGQVPYNLEYRLIKKNGEYGHFHAYGSTVRDSEGRAIRVAGALKDITKEKEYRQTLEQSVKVAQEESSRKDFEIKQFLDGIYETSNVIDLSPEGVVTGINQNLLTVWGNPDKSIFVGKHYSSFVGDENYKSVWADMVKGKNHKDVQTVTTETGKKMVFRHDYMPVCNKDGELLRVMALAYPESGKKK